MQNVASNATSFTKLGGLGLTGISGEVFHGVRNSNIVPDTKLNNKHNNFVNGSER